MKTKRRIPLFAVLFSIVFLNGLEAGGYQACLMNISGDFGLNNKAMGTLAAVQLIAILLAPLLFGRLADRSGKKRVLLPFYLVLIAGCVCILFSSSAVSFLPGIFLVGFSVSILQYVSIAALTDAYPVTGDRKMGVLTAMYALGAFVGPLLCGLMLDTGFSWKTLFALILAFAAVNALAALTSDFEPRETPSARQKEGASASGWVLPGVLLLCAIMFVYVGFENGYAFFLNSFLAGSFDGKYAYAALSAFWLAMIPSRVLCGYLGKRKGAVLVVSAAAVAAGTAAMVFVKSAWAVVALSFMLGFFSGMVYPSVLNRLNDFAAGKTATAAGMITAATGLGGAAVTAALGGISDMFGMNTGFLLLGAWIAADVVFGVILMSVKQQEENALINSGCRK